MLRVVLRIVAGFVLALLAAALVGMLFDLPFAAGSFGFEPPAQRLIRWALPLLPFAIPAGLFAILAAESQRWRHWYYWAPAGVLIGLLGFLFLTSHGAAARPAFLSGKAMVGLAAMGLAGGHVYWWIAGHRAGLLSHMIARAGRAPAAGRHESRRCWACAIAGLAFALMPFAALGWFIVHKNAAPAQIIAKAEADAANRLKAAGLADFSLKIAGPTGHVTGTSPDAESKLKAFERAKFELAPMVGLPGVVADLQNDIVITGKAAALAAAAATAPDTGGVAAGAAADAARKKAGKDAATKKAEQDRLEAESAAKKKADEAAAARKKAEQEAAARKAEDDRLADEAAAKKKADEAASARKAEDDRLAAEAAASKAKAAQTVPAAAVVEAAAGTSASGQPAAAESKSSQSVSAPTVAPDTKAQCTAGMRSLFSPTPIHFALNKADLSSDISGFLDKVAGVIKRCDGFNITIDGHTDRTGPDAFNMRLSEERAETVRAALVERGVSSQRLIARGYGKQRPFDLGRSKDAYRLNRRVELSFQEQPSGH
jgi:outer membrane protein OmpA-like peptidoglycan-associated protein